MGNLSYLNGLGPFLLECEPIGAKVWNRLKESRGGRFIDGVIVGYRLCCDVEITPQCLPNGEKLAPIGSAMHMD